MTGPENSIDLVAAYQLDAKENYQHQRYSTELTTCLRQLPRRCVIAFSLACIERNIHYLDHLADDTSRLDKVRLVLRRMWDSLPDSNEQAIAADKFDADFNAISFEQYELVGPALHVIGAIECSITAFTADPVELALKTAKSALSAIYSAVRSSYVQSTTALPPSGLTMMNIEISTNRSILNELQYQQLIFNWLSLHKDASPLKQILQIKFDPIGDKA